jgi:hypothetical protein
VAATGVNFAKRTSEPFSSPTASAPASISANPSTHTATDLPSRMKNDPTTTRNPASGPTDRSMPPSRSTKVCPSEMKPSAAHANITDVMLKSEK